MTWPTFTTLIGCACAMAAGVAAQTGAPIALPDRIAIESDVPGPSISVPTVLLVRIKKDLGEGEFMPKTLKLLAQGLTVRALSIVNPRSATSGPNFPRDVEFYWFTGPAPAFCGSGGCSSQLYWVSPSAAASGLLFPATGPDEASAFNRSPLVLSGSTNGLFDLLLFEASDRHAGSRGAVQTPGPTLRFDGHRYVLWRK